ncbi:Metallo-dependent phosphatase [Rickenella mellea]|uniref:Metallo-dependent phosphatase n=1 Tax=Rickenella mellea TaxID=50990 RepID=A0A4Y7QIK0_9AGAM|nr:Metallo-dependent phosphatase [Rickenella mellea]
MSTQARIYTTYPPDSPPLHPGKSWTRFVCISDTHSREFSVPPGDVLLHSGDLSSWGTHRQLRYTMDWLKTLPHELKIITAGNHDLSLDVKWRGSKSGVIGNIFSDLLDPDEVDASRELMQSKEIRDAGIHYLEHQAIELSTSNGIKWKFYGSPSAARYADGAFQYTSRSQARHVWSKISTDVEILLTHTPPLDVLDVTRRGKHAGCQELSNRLDHLPECRLHVFGHIHEAHGATIGNRKIGGRDVEVVSVNAAVAEGGQAVIVDLMK